MKKNQIAKFRKQFPEFDNVMAFVKRHKLPTFACSIRAWPAKREEGIPWGFSDATENVAMAICQAWTKYQDEEQAEAEKVEDISVLRNGREVSLHTNGHKLIAFTRMTAAEVKHVYATAEFRATYRYFDEALEFVKRNKMPTCKCRIRARPYEGGAEVERGYSASAVQVAEALCWAWDEYEQDLPEPDEDDRLLDILNVTREGRNVVVSMEEWKLIWFTRLTPAQVKNSKSKNGG